MLSRLDSPPSAQLLKKLTVAPDLPAKPVTQLLSPRRLTFFLIFLVLKLVFLFLFFPSIRFHSPITISVTSRAILDQCKYGKVYVYNLPKNFNNDLLDACNDLNPWQSTCDALSNGGFGLPATDLARIVPDVLLPSWYTTDQFSAELIYYRRILAHPCRTTDPSTATAFYIPFYAGLAISRHLWSPNSTFTDRDRDSAELLSWLSQQQPYQSSGGNYHFMVLGRITWDFQRTVANGWGSSFLNMQGMQNVTRLLIERDPWSEREVAIPYPTGFHPRSAADVLAWQKFVLKQPRPALFSFVGAPRANFMNDFRGLLLNECKLAGAACRAVDCSRNRCGGDKSAEMMGGFLGSRFCLQPRGDSFTRRSMFDCMVAGAIPVLFWRRTAEVQYEWYLRGEGDGEGEWSVFMNRTEVRSGVLSVREVLEGIGEERVRRMRERVVEMIPRLVYAAEETGIGGRVKDAFDVAVDGVMRRFSEWRQAAGKRGSEVEV